MAGIEPKDIVLVYGRHEPGAETVSLMAMVQGQPAAVPIVELSREQAIAHATDLLQAALEIR